MKRLKAFKVPETKRTYRKPAVKRLPTPESSDLIIPRFSTEDLLILGKRVGSVLEWNVSQALEMFPLEYRYQVPVFGGRIRGGSIVDFEIFTVPLHTYCFAQGDYWHHRMAVEEEDQFAMARIEAVYHKPVIEIWEHEALTIQLAYASLKAKLHQ